MKKLTALLICALFGSSAGYVCAPVLSVWMLQSSEPEMFSGSSLALYKNTVVCDCNERPAGEGAKDLSKYLSTLQAAKAKNQNSEVLPQEIGLTYIRLSMVEEKLQRQSQADQDMEHGQTKLSAVGWRDVSKSHLKSLVMQLNSEYKKLDKKDKPISAAIAAP